MLALENIKSHFPILNQNDGIIYLDNAATTLKPQPVIDAVLSYYTTHTANVHRGDFNYAQKTNYLYEETREIAKNFINADSKKEIVFTFGTTHALNWLSRSLVQNLKEKDEIILTHLEHSSNYIPWQILAKEKNLVLKYIPCNKEGELDLEEYKKLISPKTKIVSSIYVSNSIGSVSPIKTMASIAHKNNALFVVDAAQAAGHLKIDVQNLDVDFLVLSSHKICGPTGVGFLYGKKKLLENLPNVFGGGGSVVDINLEKNKTVFSPLPHRFEAGTPAIEGVIGMGTAINFLTNIGLDAIKKKEQELYRQTLSLLNKLDFITLYTNKQSEIPIFSIDFKGVHPHDVGTILNDYNIAVRTGKHCNYPLLRVLNLSSLVRASFSFYNSIEDSEALVKGLYKVKEIMHV